MTGRIMALDVGDRRIGIALSDALMITAQGLETYTREDDNTEKDISYIIDKAKAHNAAKIVFGLPKNMDGTIGFQAEKVQEFARAVQEKFDGEIDFFDERGTTISAHEALRTGGLKTKKHKSVVDKIAAVIILQAYLERYGG